MSNILHPDFRRDAVNDNPKRKATGFELGVLCAFEEMQKWLVANDHARAFDYKSGRQTIGYLVQHLDECIEKYKKENGL